VLNVNGHHLCTAWTTQEYIQCGKKSIREDNLPKLNCTIYNFKEYLDPAEVNLPTCNTMDSAAKAFDLLAQYGFVFLQSTPESKCKAPCTQTSYNIDVDYLSKYSYMNPAKPEMSLSKYFHLDFFFKKIHLEERTETLVYDFVSFLSAGGGNLGLFVGFSCLSVLYAIYNCIEKYFLKSK